RTGWRIRLGHATRRRRAPGIAFTAAVGSGILVEHAHRSALLEDAHIGQVAIALGRVHAVAHDELIADAPARVVDRHLDLAAGDLVEQRGDPHTRGAAGP